MLKNEVVTIKIRKDQIDYYSNLGYIITKNEIDVLSKHLNRGSSTIITVICDNCGEELKLEYKNYYKVISKYSDSDYSDSDSDSDLYYCKKCKYCRIKKTNIEKYGVENIMQDLIIANKVSEKLKNNNKRLSKKERSKILENKIIDKYGDLKKYYNNINKTKTTNCLNKYGVENVMQVNDIKIKGQKTCLNKYGEYNPMFVDKFIKKSTSKSIKTKLERGLIIPEDKLNDFEKYRRIIRRLVYKFKPILFNEWSGYDYYDNEYIKDYLNLYHTDNRYPSIDHKISVYEGFTNNIDPCIIGDIQNMCITKRGINSSKCYKSKPNQDYLNKIKK